ncbi:MAG: GNAT family N-acetyltransferase [Bacillota bacterium]
MTRGGSPIKLERFDAPAEFYRRAAGFLLNHEADHNLMLGIANGLIEHPERVQGQPYLAIVLDGGTVVAAAVMTPPRNLVLSRVSAADGLWLIAEDVYREYRRLPGVLGPSPVSLTFADRWQRRSGQPFQKARALRIYQLDQVRPASRAPGDLRRATEADRDLLIRWMAAFGAEALGQADAGEAEQRVDALLQPGHRGLFLWYDGRPVSMAGYSGPTGNGIRVSAVYTPPEYRRRGYASACVSALSQFLLDTGYKYCFLFTDLSNPTSNHIYQEMGYRPVCDVDEYRFMDPDSRSESRPAG